MEWAQVAITSISITYSIDQGTDSSGTVVNPGIVNASTLDCYYNKGSCPTGLGTREQPQTLAHAYGGLVNAYESCPYNILEDIRNANQTCSYFTQEKGQEFALRYVEYNPRDLSHAYPFLTDRVITASTGQCFEYYVKNRTTVGSSLGPALVRSIDFANDTYTGNIQFPKQLSAHNATIYVYNGTHKPQNEDWQSCGDRCIWIHAFSSPGKGQPRMFSCPITISNVTNTMEPAQELPADMARLAAASIALSGRFTYPWRNTTRNWQQYQHYPRG